MKINQTMKKLFSLGVLTATLAMTPLNSASAMFGDGTRHLRVYSDGRVEDLTAYDESMKMVAQVGGNLILQQVYGPLKTGWEAYNQGDYSTAYYVANDALKKYPNFLDYKMLRVYSGIKLGEFKAILNDAIDCNEQKPNIQFVQAIGIGYYQRGNYAQADRYFTKVLDEISTSSEIYGHFLRAEADCKSKLGQDQEAEKYARRAVNYLGEDETLCEIIGKANIKNSNGTYYLKKAVTANPKDRILDLLLENFNATGVDVEAQHKFVNDYAYLHQDSALAYHELGKYFWDKKNYKKAADCYEKMYFNIDTKQEKARFARGVANLALAHKELGSYVTAQMYSKKASSFAKDPDDKVYAKTVANEIKLMKAKK